MKLRSVLFFLLFSFTVSGTESSALHVLSVTPRGEIHDLDDARSIIISFNESMAALGEIPNPEKNLLTISPPVSGTYRWMGPKKLVYLVDDALTRATRYEVTLHQGLTSLNGHVLASNYTWAFETERPRLKESYPDPNDGEISTTPTIFLRFSHRMSPGPVKKFIQFRDLETGALIPVELTTPTRQSMRRLYNFRRDTSKVLRVRPTQALEKGRQYELVMQRGLPSPEGELGTDKTVSLSFFTTRPLHYYGVEKITVVDRRTRFDYTINFSFSSDISSRQLAKNISFDPPVQIDTSDYFIRRGRGRSTLTLPLEPDRLYHFTLSSEVQNTFGEKLGSVVHDTLRTPSLPSRLFMQTGQFIQSAAGDLTFPISFLNIDSVCLRIAAVPPDSLALFFQGNFYFSPYDSLPNVSFDVDKVWHLDSARNKKVERRIDLKPFLNKQGHGFVFLDIEQQQDFKKRRHHRVLIQATDLAVTAKWSPLKKIIHVNSLSDGSAVARARVKIFSDPKTLLWEGRTDHAGLIELPKDATLYERTRRLTHFQSNLIMVQKKDDVACARLGWGPGSCHRRPGPTVLDGRPFIRDELIFSDRGLYQPGETVHLKGIIRLKTANGLEIPEQRSYRVEVRDYKDNRVFYTTASVSKLGTWEAVMKLKPDAAHGPYFVNDQQGRESAFQVYEFKRAPFQISISNDRQSYVRGDTLTTTVNAAYLHGLPMAKAAASMNVKLSLFHFKHKAYPDYTFAAADAKLWAGAANTLRAYHNFHFDDSGRFFIKTPLIADSLFAPLQLTLSASASGADRQEISTKESVILHPATFYIGLSPEESFVSSGDSIRCKAVSITPDGAAIKKDSIFVGLYKREWRKKRTGKSARPDYKRIESIVDSLYISTSTSPVAFSFLTSDPGSFLLRARAKDEKGRPVISERSIYVTGKKRVPWRFKDDNCLELTADKNLYKPGETAHILIQSPFENAKALVTVEREGVFDYWTTDVQGHAPKLDIALQESDLPNIFVSVHLVDSQNNDGEAAEFRLGAINLSLDPSEKKLQVTATSPTSSYRPGDKVTLDIAVTDADGRPVRGEAVIAVVDEGVTSHIGYDFPDALAHFYKQRDCKVWNMESRSRIFIPPSDGALMLDRSSGNIMVIPGSEVRDDFRACAYWNAGVKIRRGKGRVEFTLPDNLTSYKVLIMAVSGDSYFGNGATFLKVNKPLMIQPSLPRFVRVEDTFQAGVIVHNATGRDATVLVDARSEGLELLDRPAKTVTVAAGLSKEVAFSFAATDTGAAHFYFAAATEDAKDAMQADIPVLAPRRKETVALYHSTVEAQSREEIYLAENIYKNLSMLDISLAATAMENLYSSFAYVAAYPHGCLEQLTSKILAYLVAPELFSINHGGSYRRKVQKLINNISQYQRNHASFALWPGENFGSPYLTAYATYALCLARSKGFTVDERMLSPIAGGFRDFLDYNNRRNPFGSYDQKMIYMTRAFMIYLLRRWPDTNRGYLIRDVDDGWLYQNRFDAPISGLSFLIKAIYQHDATDARIDTLAQELQNRLRTSAAYAYFEATSSARHWYAYESNVRSTALALDALLDTGREPPYTHQIVSWLFSQRRDNQWQNTQDNVFALLALSKYFRKYEVAPPFFRAEVKIMERSVLNANFAKKRKSRHETSIALDDAPAGRLPVDIHKKGDGRLYYGLRLSTYPKDAAQPRDEGLTVVKEMSPLDSSSTADSLRAGGYIKITLYLATDLDRQFVVVDDPLPAGLEAVQFALKTSKQALRREESSTQWRRGFNHIEKRNDRVLLYADALPAGVYRFSYIARVITPGRFVMPSTYAEEMYSPEVYGRSGDEVVVVY